MTTSAEDIKAKFESLPLEARQRSSHINGLNEPPSPNKKIPPPVPPKRKPSKDSGGASVLSNVESNVSIAITDEGKDNACVDSMSSLRKEIDELKMSLSLAGEELKTITKANKRLQRKLDGYENLTKARKAQGSLKKWYNPQPSLCDLKIQLAPEALSDAQELVQQFVESERLYLNNLETIHHYFYQPMKMMAVFKRDIISTQQLEAIFLNCSQLVVLHRFFYSQLYHLRYLPKNSRVEEFLVILEKTVPSLSLYCGFQAEFFMQNLQKELSQCNSKPQLRLLMKHMENDCVGKSLADLLRIPAGRLSEYINFLNPFLEERVKGTRYVNDNVIKRIQAIIRFITSLQVEQMDEKSEWECIVEKLKILTRIPQDGPIPLELFNPETRLVKQGPVIVTEKGKEVQKMCFLFTTHIAVVEKTSNHHVFTEESMRSLVGASLYINVDMAGHIIQPDIHSGLEQDMLGFRVNFITQDYIILKVGRPNEKKQWVENIDKTLEEIRTSTADVDDDEITVPDITPKIAAASLEKLFQRLTSPQFAYREDFIEVFLNTYPCFTTSKDVLTALLNCIKHPKEKTPDPSASLNTQGHVFTFNMEDNMDTVSTSASFTASLSQNCSSGSEDSDVADSPNTPRKKRLTDDVPSNMKTNPSFNRVSMSTDSDTSPYTSGVPVAASDSVKKEALNGWQEQRHSGLSADSSYVTLSRPLSRESGDLGDTEDEMTNFPRPSLGFTTPMSLPSGGCELMGNFDEISSVSLTMGGVLSFSKMNESLDETQKMLYELHQNMEVKPIKQPVDDCFNPLEDEDNFRKYTGKMRGTRRNSEHNSKSKRLSTSSTLSFSESDLVSLSIKPQRSVDNSSTKYQDENELLNSLPPTVARKFTDASPSHLMISPSRRNRFSVGFKSKKSISDKSRNKSLPNTQRLSVNPSSSLYFGSPEPQNKSPGRSFALFKKKDKKGMHKSTSTNFTDSSGSDTLNRRGLLKRAPSLGPIKSSNTPYYANVDEIPSIVAKCEGSPTLRRASHTPNNLINRIFSVLNKWIETRPEDFINDDELRDLLENFLQTTIDLKDSHTARLAIDLQDILSIQSSRYNKSCSSSSTSFGVLLSRVTTIEADLLQDIDWDKPAKVIIGKELDLSKPSRELSLMVSEQISLIGLAYYSAVMRSELLNCNWKKKDREIRAPNICEIILKTNQLTSWICTEVLSRETVGGRSAVIENFIMIAWNCYKHNDMHNALSVTLALSSSCIKRLSKSWDALDRKVRQKYEKLKDATDHHEKCKKLRERLEDVTNTSLDKNGDIPPALPYVGAYLELIYTLDVGTNTYNDDGLVNFAKMTKLSSLIDTVLQYQDVPFNFQPKIDVMAYISSAKRLTDNELYDLSVQREPSVR